VLTESSQEAPVTSRRLALGARNPRVSVIIPAYNTSRFIGDTLESVFAQTYKDFEVVVVNDGSPDTLELERVIAPWRDNITYLHTENCGLAGARNNGIRACNGELVALLDSDDTWEPNYLEVQVRKLDEDPSADIVYPRAIVFGTGPDVGRCSKHSAGDVTFSSLVQEENSVIVSVLARRSALEAAGLFDDSLRSCEDFDMWLRCLKTGSRIIYHDEVLLRYRSRPDSLSADPVWMYDHAAKVMRKIQDSAQLTNRERRDVESAIHRFEGKKLYYQGKKAFLDGDDPLAVDLLERANTHFRSLRLRLILIALRTRPQIVRAAYGWRLHQRAPLAWLVRRDIR
jgi:glycosyltransferase involved in cell wall biosynthesis